MQTLVLWALQLKTLEMPSCERSSLLPSLMSVSKLTSLGHLEMTWRSRIHFHPLLVRVLHKSRLRYYGKPEKKMDVPYQVRRR